MSAREDIQTWDTSTILMVTALGGVAAFGAIATLGTHAWAWATGVEDVSWNPFDIVIALATGTLDTGVWTWIGGIAGAVTLLLTLLAVFMARARNRRKRGDAAAHLTGSTKDIAPIMSRDVKAKAQRFGGTGEAFGLPIGRSVSTRAPLWSSFEDVCIDIAGPRTGKTTSWVVPRIYAAPGAVVATSNKRDIVDVTRERRHQTTGQRVWVFDPQGIAGETQSWWWDPLSYVTNAVQAQALTTVFIDAVRNPNATTNAFFDDAAGDLVAGMLLAAAVGRLPITVLHTWLNDQTNDEPVMLLKRHGQSMMGQTLEGTMNLVPETRSGVYGGAAQIMSFLLNEDAMNWVTPTEGVPQFQPSEFVRTSETLYCLSQEGRGSASPVVTALTVAVTEAAVEYAKTQPGGRLVTPMLIELDEAANVCRWRELPDMYSHFGSRGICVDTVLQSWSQGSTVWGEAGIKKLWSASNVKVYGGGVSERDFLALISDLIGVHWVDSTQISTSTQGRSVSTSKASQQRPIATVADLQALPAGRAWVFASGATGVLAHLVPWWEHDKQTKTSA
jgi:type IV secretory pathway TraG/TraD family ATPase VirD4